MGGRRPDEARRCDAVQSRGGFSPPEQHIRGLHATVNSRAPPRIYVGELEKKGERPSDRAASISMQTRSR